MGDPRPVGDCLPDAFIAVLEAAWRRDGLAWSGPAWPEPPAAPVVEGDGW